MEVDNGKAFPVKLGELKPLLREEAHKQNRSLHNLIKTILKEYVLLKFKGVEGFKGADHNRQLVKLPD